MTRRMGLLVIAVLAAVVGTLAVGAYVRGADARAAAGQTMKRVLVATATIPAGTKAGDFSSAQTELKELPAAAVPDGALTSLSGVSGLVTVGEIVPNEVLTQQRFTEAARTGSLTIPSGKLAVSVELKDPQRVAGFVVPGSEVAVYDTFDAAHVNVSVTQTGANTAAAQATGDDKATRILLTRALVIAVGPTVTAKSSEGVSDNKSVPTTVLTVALDQPDAQKLVHAAQTGDLYFALLGPGAAPKSAPAVDNTTLFQ